MHDLVPGDGESLDHGDVIRSLSFVVDRRDGMQGKHGSVLVQ